MTPEERERRRILRKLDRHPKRYALARKPRRAFPAPPIAAYVDWRRTIDWYELALHGGSQLVVPEAALITGGDRAWRREETT